MRDAWPPAPSRIPAFELNAAHCSARQTFLRSEQNFFKGIVFPFHIFAEKTYSPHATVQNVVRIAAAENL